MDHTTEPSCKRQYICITKTLHLFLKHKQTTWSTSCLFSLFLGPFQLFFFKKDFFKKTLLRFMVFTANIVNTIVLELQMIHQKCMRQKSLFGIFIIIPQTYKIIFITWWNKKEAKLINYCYDGSNINQIQILYCLAGGGIIKLYNSTVKNGNKSLYIWCMRLILNI